MSALRRSYAPVMTKVPELAFILPSLSLIFYTVNYKKTRPHGGGTLFLEMYLLQRMI